jgi:acyl-CoA thioesterase YciA
MPGNSKRCCNFSTAWQSFNRSATSQRLNRHFVTHAQIARFDRFTELLHCDQLEFFNHAGSKMKESDIDDVPTPNGELSLQTVAMPRDTNANGDIFGGWLVSQMDLAAMITATRVAKGRAVTVAINGMAFYTPVQVGSVVSCYTEVLEVGRSSVRINVEVWIARAGSFEQAKVTEGEFVFVAIDEKGRTRPVKS